jgi:hypothetical protein
MSFHFRHDGLYINGVLHESNIQIGNGVSIQKPVNAVKRDVADHIKAMLGM